MSVQALSWVLDNSESEHAARLVLISIANHCDKFGHNAWPSVGSIASESRLCERVVRSAIVELENAGELKVLRGAGPHRTNLYSLPKMQGAKNTPVENAGAEFPAEVQNSSVKGAKFFGAIRKNRPEPSFEPSSVKNFIFQFVATIIRQQQIRKESVVVNAANVARHFSEEYGCDVSVSLVEEAIEAAQAKAEAIQ